MPLGTEVRLGPCDVALDGGTRKGHGSPLFSADVYCGHSRPSQLLLSSCLWLFKVLFLIADKDYYNGSRV